MLAEGQAAAAISQATTGPVLTSAHMIASAASAGAARESEQTLPSTDHDSAVPEVSLRACTHNRTWVASHISEARVWFQSNGADCVCRPAAGAILSDIWPVPVLLGCKRCTDIVEHVLCRDDAEMSGGMLLPVCLSNTRGCLGTNITAGLTETLLCCNRQTF